MVYLPIFEEFLSKLRCELRAAVIRNFFWNTVPPKILSEMRNEAIRPTVASLRSVNARPMGVEVNNNCKVATPVVEIISCYRLLQGA